ncbi:hypothetical protein HOD38_04915 [archaeon]|jgi:hypothetical protein|nr:hypothetical protein [archaeon]MBT4397582.1 hypothetical protein [archaeon]MBT4440837.1 hypothetical protein [archaeon]
MEQLQRLIQESGLEDQAACKDNILMLGNSLFEAFGINGGLETDYERGYEKAREFLGRVCGVFDDPTHLVRIAPFAYAFLGEEMFNRTLDVVLQKARDNPDDRSILDQVFSGATLLRPELRAAFLSDISAADVLDDGLFGIDDYISDVDPSLQFESADAFPSQFTTANVRKATELLGKYLQMGVFRSGVGFTENFEALNQSMEGFGYLMERSTDDLTLIVTRDPVKFMSMGLGNVAFTDRITARPQGDGDQKDFRYPGTVLVDDDVSLQEVQRFYADATVVYLNRDVPTGFEHLVVGDDEDVIGAHLRFISKNRKEGLVHLGAMLEAEVRNAEDLVSRGNEYFLDVRKGLEDLGRRDLIDRMVEAGGYSVPHRTDANLMVLVSPKRKDLADIFEGRAGADKRMMFYRELPTIEDTGMPFVFVTTEAIPQSEILAAYPSATILYVAENDAKEKAILAVDENAFVVNEKTVAPRGRFRGTDKGRVGDWVVNSFFDRIARARGEGITSMYDIARGISDEVKDRRDKIMFATHLRGFYDEAAPYYRLQEQFGQMPLVLQLTDGVLMESCPTGGCFNLDAPDTGGCCGGGNLPGVLIDFAIAYRKQVGEERFMRELTAYHDGDVREPWYFDSTHYQRHFKGLTETADQDGMIL